MPLFLLMYFPSKQVWVEIYILINIFDMSMLWLKLNGNMKKSALIFQN